MHHLILFQIRLTIALIVNNSLIIKAIFGGFH